MKFDRKFHNFSRRVVLWTRKTGSIDRLSRENHFRLLVNEFSILLNRFGAIYRLQTCPRNTEKCKFLLTLPRGNDLLSHSAMRRRHEGAIVHLCLAGELDLSCILEHCDLSS